jgi:CBS domain-containing protein
MKIKDVMTREVRACGPDDSLERAAQLMWEGDCGCTPIVEDGSRVVGMLTDRDICMAAYTRGERLSAIRARDAMSGELHVCSPGDDVALVENRMRDFRVRRLPVIDGDRLVGIVSLNDLAIRATAKGRDIRFEEVGKTLAGVCEHRAPTTGQRVRAA